MTEEIKTVLIRFGPYEAHGVVSHRRGRFKVLCEELVGLGLSYVLRPWHHWDRAQMSICGHVAFECRLTNLRFNMTLDLDPVCQRAVAAIVDMADRIEHADNARKAAMDKEKEAQEEGIEEQAEEVAEEEQVPSYDIKFRPAKLTEVDENAPEELISTIIQEPAFDQFSNLPLFGGTIVENADVGIEKMEATVPEPESSIKSAETLSWTRSSSNPPVPKPMKFSRFSDVVEINEDVVNPIPADSENVDDSDSAIKKSNKFALALDAIEDEEKLEAIIEPKVMNFPDERSDSEDSLTSPPDRPRKSPMFADEVDIVDDDMYGDFIVEVLPPKIERTGRVMLPEEAEDFFIPLKQFELFPLPKQ